MGKPETKTNRVNLRVADRDTELFRQAAAVVQESLSEFLLASERERPERLLADRTRFVICEKRWADFNAALESPAQAKPELAELFSRPRPW